MLVTTTTCPLCVTPSTLHPRLPPTMSRLTLLLLLILLPLAACAPPATPPPATTSGLLTPLSFNRSGGFAGFDDQIKITQDGNYTVTRRGAEPRKAQLTPAETTRLAALLSASRLFAADHHYETPGADQFIYTIVYNGHTVTAVDGAIPAELQPVLDHLVALIQP